MFETIAQTGVQLLTDRSLLLVFLVCVDHFDVKIAHLGSVLVYCNLRVLHYTAV